MNINIESGIDMNSRKGYSEDYYVETSLFAGELLPLKDLLQRTNFVIKSMIIRWNGEEGKRWGWLVGWLVEKRMNPLVKMKISFN